MKYFKALSAELNNDTFICAEGKVYVFAQNRMKLIGSINDSIHTLKDNI